MAFVGKVVLVTGGAGCLGFETAKRFYGEGASVIILDKDIALLEAAKKLLPNVSIVVADLLDWDATRTALKNIGPVDHLVNNAGVNNRQNFLEITPEAIDFIFGVNFKAIVNVSQEVAKGMIASGKGGTIVNISSFASKANIAKISMYAASKSAVNMLTRSMAVELGPHKIRVNAVCPHYMVTTLTSVYIENNPELFEGMLNRTPIRRFVEPAETVDSIIFLSSTSSSMINGTALDIDGGYVAAS